MEDYFYLILQYFELSDEMRDFWVKYWDDDDKEDPYDFSKKTIKKMKKQLEGARPRLSNFTLHQTLIFYTASTIIYIPKNWRII